MWSKGPETFVVHGNAASVSADEHEAQEIINHFKDWLPLVNQKYKEIVIHEKNLREEQARHRLQAELEEEERIQRIRKSIKI